MVKEEGVKEKHRQVQSCNNSGKYSEKYSEMKLEGRNDDIGGYGTEKQRGTEVQRHSDIESRERERK